MRPSFRMLDDNLIKKIKEEALGIIWITPHKFDRCLGSRKTNNLLSTITFVCRKKT